MHYRHGDISLHLVLDIKGNKIGGSGFVCALGEATGHKHIITGDVVVYRDEFGNTYFKVGTNGASLTHEEHKEVKVSKGLYQMKNEREFNWFEKAVQRVID